MLRVMKVMFAICSILILSFILLSIFSSTPSPQGTFQSFFSQTHHKLSQLHKLKTQPLDNDLLADLGFVKSPIVYPRHTWENLTAPAIVTSVAKHNFDLLPEFLSTTEMFAPSSSSLVVYTLDLSEAELKEVGNICNKSSCHVFSFDFSLYPSHVRDLKLEAYRSIIIQEMLQRVGIVFWVSLCVRLDASKLPFATSHFNKSNETPLLQQWTQRALNNGGVLTWRRQSFAPNLPTAALTHPDMFHAFMTHKRNYDFQIMSDPNAVLLVNTPHIHRLLLFPWVSCSLTLTCLSPVGAQESGCNYNKRPLFRYSGCHLYDTSAFNLALGLAFGMDNESYLDSSRVFRCYSSISEESEMASKKMKIHSSFSPASDSPNFV